MDARHIGSGWISSDEPRDPLGWLARITLYVAVAGMLAAFLVSAASPLLVAGRDTPAASTSATQVHPAVHRKHVSSTNAARRARRGRLRTRSLRSQANGV